MGAREVLVVDDDRDLRVALALALEQEGHTVIEAEHGQHALELMAKRPPHLIILDLTMPVMDGRAFLAAKSKGEHANIPVVVFSSSPPNEIGSMASVETVVHKLAGVDALLAAIRRVAQKLSPAAEPSSFTRLERQLFALGLLEPAARKPCSSCGQRLPVFEHLQPALCLRCLGRARGVDFADPLA